MRPGFFVTAPLAGSGKTTVLSMVSTAVLGRAAAATGWSLSEEERQKALFSYLVGGVPLLVWDNIQNGTDVSSEAVDRSLTAETFSPHPGEEPGGRGERHDDPVLDGQHHRAERRPGEPMLRGDACRQLASTPRTGSSSIPNPVGWSLSQRLKILEAIYTILCLPRPVIEQGETRYKDWWRLVGQPIEMVAPQGVSFGAMMQTNTKLDPVARDHAVVLTALRDKFGVEAVHGVRCRHAAATERGNAVC